MIFNPTKSKQILISLFGHSVNRRGIKRRHDGNVKELFALGLREKFLDVFVDIVGQKGCLDGGTVYCDV